MITLDDKVERLKARSAITALLDYHEWMNEPIRIEGRVILKRAIQHLSDSSVARFEAERLKAPLEKKY